MSKDKSTGERIFEILKERGITQVELSKRTGIPTSTINDWKKKNNTPTAEKIALVAKALQVKPEDILIQKNAEIEYRVIYSDDPLWEVIEMFEDSDKERNRRLLAYLKAFQEMKN